jgi:putative ABC transport system permease protein
VFVGPDDLDGVITEIATQTKNSSMPAQGVESGRFHAGFAKRAATIPVALGFLGLFLVFTTGLTLANNCAISIRERRVEVSTLRVLGYYPRSILRLLVSEAVLIGVVGGLVGVIITYLAFRAGMRLTPKEIPPAKLDAISIAAGMAVAVIVPLLGSLPSALAAVRVPLVDGLRESA